MRILVVGAGAVGGYFGARLAQAGRDVTFLVRPKRAEEIRSNGVQLVRDSNVTTVQVPTVTADRLASAYDVVILTVPSFGLIDATNDFAPAVGPETMILPFLNGMRHLDMLQQRFGSQAVVGGVCLVTTELDKENRVVQLSDIQRLTYGELDGRTTPRLERLHGALSNAGFETVLSTSIVQGMWNKWVQIASLGAVTCLLRGNIGEINEIEAGKSTALRLVEECNSVASAAGHPPSDAFLERLTSSLTAKGSWLTSSLYRNLVAGHQVEADSILGDLTACGRANQVETPLLDAAFAGVAIYQQRQHRSC